MIRTIAFLAAIAVMPTLAIALAPPAPHLGPSLIVQASQSIDSCYKKCFLDAKGKSSRKYACSRVCNAKPKKKCEDKCWLKLGNDPKKRKSCLSRCS